MVMAAEARPVPRAPSPHSVADRSSMAPAVLPARAACSGFERVRRLPRALGAVLACCMLLALETVHAFGLPPQLAASTVGCARSAAASCAGSASSSLRRGAVGGSPGEQATADEHVLSIRYARAVTSNASGRTQPGRDAPPRVADEPTTGALGQGARCALPSVAAGETWPGCIGRARCGLLARRPRRRPNSTTRRWRRPSSPSGSTSAPRTALRRTPARAEEDEMSDRARAAPDRPRGRNMCKAGQAWRRACGCRPRRVGCAAASALGLPLAFAALPIYVHAAPVRGGVGLARAGRCGVARGARR